MKYRLIVLGQAERDLKRVAAKDRPRIASAIDGLADDPRPRSSRRLKGTLAHMRRLRVGDYRVGYEINEAERTVLVRAIGHRHDFYGRLRRSH